MQDTTANATGAGTNVAVEANGDTVLKYNHVNINGTESAISGGTITTAASLSAFVA